MESIVIKQTIQHYPCLWLKKVVVAEFSNFALRFALSALYEIYPIVVTSV